MINHLQFTSEAYAAAERTNAWCVALGLLGVHVSGSHPQGALLGDVTCVRSPLGFEFARLTSSPVSLSIEPVNGRAVWLILILEGSGTIFEGKGNNRIGASDIAYGLSETQARLDFSTNSRLLLVNLPSAALNSRLLGAASRRRGVITAASGIAHVFSGLLRVVAETIDELSAEHLHPVEAGILEFFLTSLVASEQTGSTPGMATGPFLARIYQCLESKLHDPSLSLGDVAHDQRISARYLQKLFEAAGETFSHYVRIRRIERSRLDLANPVLSRLSISEICFRWGFNDAAHFSRAFREHCGMSPREYRSASKNQTKENEKLQAPTSRGRPDVSIETNRKSGNDRPTKQPTQARSTLVDLKQWVGQTSRNRTGDAAHGATRARQHHVAVSEKTIHWGYLSPKLKPILEIASGDVVTMETLTHHAYDDYERLIAGDPGAEAVFHWTKEKKNVDRRGAGPADSSIFGRGAGEGFGVHICTGPVAVIDARPGDVMEVRVLDVRTRPSVHPTYVGRSFGSNAAAWWGLHYDELLTEPKPREVVTIYEIMCAHGCAHAKALYNFRWTPQCDPFGVVHKTIDYPGVPVDHSTIEKDYNVLANIRIPLRPHFGFIGLAPRETEFIDSIPPGYFGGNLDNWRLGKGAKVFLPVSVPGALFSVGDPHASQGDAELCGTAIECSLTGDFEFILHKKDRLDAGLRDLSYPLIETPTEWVVQGLTQPNYLAALGQNAQSEIYKRSSLDDAMRDAFRKVRRFLMNTKNLSEDEAISLISVAVDFGITQVVNGNWGVHAVVRKELFEARDRLS